MGEARELELEGSEGRLFAAEWPNADARYIAVVVHGYAEHIGRYAHVIERLLADGAVVYGLDHLGHGRSDGDRALIADGEHLTADLDLLVQRRPRRAPGPAAGDDRPLDGRPDRHALRADAPAAA